MSPVDLNGNTGRDLDHAASRLGVSKFTVRALVRRRELSHYKLGRRLIFMDRDLDDYLQRHRVEARKA